MSDAYDQLEVTSAAELRRWLKGHHNSSPGIWLVTYKKGAGEKYLAYEDIVCEALCYGWIDSKGRTLDTRRSQLLTPRKPSSSWSRPNKERVARLESDGRMAGPGRAMVELAKASGTWSALDDVENLIEPSELATALNAHPAARANWDAFPRSPGVPRWSGSATRSGRRPGRSGSLRPSNWPPRTSGLSSGPGDSGV
jgi:uncharacterized protein YdeI (YjbR/CyaY-like superfamily)